VQNTFATAEVIVLSECPILIGLTKPRRGVNRRGQIAQAMPYDYSLGDAKTTDRAIER